MFSLKLVARPDARMVEVPLEIEAELPREFEGAALLAASGLPRKVKIKAQKDAVKLSTAYRTDQLAADIVKASMRGTAQDAQRVQDAVGKFIRTVRERRQDGATLVISSNGRGRIDVTDHMPQAVRSGAPAITPHEVPRLGSTMAPDRLAAIERRLGELEAGFARFASGADPAGKVPQLEERLNAMQAQLARALAAADVAGPGMDSPRPGAQVITRQAAATHKTTAVEAYAEGLRHELLASAQTAFNRAKTDTERCDKALALAAEAELLGAPSDGTTQRLRDSSAQSAARQSALERLAQEIEFYAHADLPVAHQLLHRLEDGPRAPDPVHALEPVAQALVRAARGGDCKVRTKWLKRGATLCGWTLVEPKPGDRLDPEWHQAVDSGGETVTRLACPGLKRADGSGVVRARVHIDPAVAKLPEEPDEPEAVPEPIAPPPSEPPPDEPAAARAPEPVAVKTEEERALPHDTPQDVAPVPAASSSGPIPLPPPTQSFTAPFGDLAGAGEIRPEEANAAAVSSSRIPKIVSEDPARNDEALAAEVALAVETEMSSQADPEWAQVARGPQAFESAPHGPDEVPEEVGDDQVEEVHELTEPIPDEDESPS